MITSIAARELPRRLSILCHARVPVAPTDYLVVLVVVAVADEKVSSRIRLPWQEGLASARPRGTIYTSGLSVGLLFTSGQRRIKNRNYGCISFCILSACDVTTDTYWMT